MSVGTPVVATAIRGNVDLLRDGRGLLYPLGDINALASCIRRVIEDKSGVAEMTAKAKAHVPHFALEKTLPLYEQIYELVLSDAKKEARQLVHAKQSFPRPMPH